MIEKIYLIGGSGYIGRNLMKVKDIRFINIRSWQNVWLPNSANLIYLAGNSNTNLKLEESKEDLIKERENLNFYLNQDINVYYLSSFRTLNNDVSDYSNHKLKCEEYCKDRSQSILRLSSVFGNEYKRTIIMNDICKILVNNNLKLKNPCSMVNIVNINNIVDAILNAVKFEHKGIYNLVMSNSIKSGELLDIIINNINLKEPNKIDYSFELDHSYETYDSEYYLNWNNKLPIHSILNHVKNYKAQFM